jgi:hypothetical protein
VSAQITAMQRFELATELGSILTSAGWGHADLRIALDALNELIDQGVTSPSELIAGAKSMAEDEFTRAGLMERQNEHTRAVADKLAAARNAPAPSAGIGTKSTRPRGPGSPHTSSRSNDRQPGFRWDQREDD